MNRKSSQPPLTELDVLRDLMLGGRHSRLTVVRGFQVSTATADRWLGYLLARIPGVRRTRVSKTTWFEWKLNPVPNETVRDYLSRRLRTARDEAEDWSRQLKSATHERGKGRA